VMPPNNPPVPTFVLFSVDSGEVTDLLVLFGVFPCSGPEPRLQHPGCSVRSLILSGGGADRGVEST
jgi:hypothetical protein